MSNFTPLLKPLSQKIPNQFLRGLKSGGASPIIKDALPLTTWLALGAILNGLLILLLGRIALLIPTLYILLKVLSTFLSTVGITTNPWSKNVISGKFSAQIPNDDGTYGPTAASSSVTVFLIGARSNHPLGLLAPNLKKIGGYMSSLQRDIDARADEYGLIGSSSWVSTDRSSGNDFMYVMYFRSYAGLHKFAHDPLHREAWNGWNAMYKDTPHFSIWHEAFVAPKGMWETVYANSHPTLLGAGQVKVDGEKGEERWMSTLVDASRGVLRSSKGRMAGADGGDNEKLGLDPYVDVAVAPGQL